METRDETSTPVLRIFGREPVAEDWRNVGRWAYASAWLSEDAATARQLVRARLAGASALATAAAMAAGRGDAERFTLVSALARLSAAFETGEGALVDAAERTVEEMSAQLVRDGAALRAATSRERSALMPRFSLESFAAALLDVGQDRHVFLREAASSLDEAMTMVRGSCPALKTLSLFLHATLALDAQDASSMLEAAPGADSGPIPVLALWLTADLALSARRARAFETAWSMAARASGDALSRALAGLASGAMVMKGVVDAFQEDPWALALALAMTSEPEHAGLLLDCGAQAQQAARIAAARAVERWAAQGSRIEELEEKLGLAVIASAEAREGYRELLGGGALDLFSAWNVVRLAEECTSALRQAAERSVAAETTRRKEEVRRARIALEAARGGREAAIEGAREQAKSTEAPVQGPSEAAEQGAQRGCLFGLGAGAAVMATYVAVGLFAGPGGPIERIAPLVVGVAALPVIAGILSFVAVSARRASALAERTRQRDRASREFDRLKAAAEKAHNAAVEECRQALFDAEAQLNDFERQALPELKAA